MVHSQRIYVPYFGREHFHIRVWAGPNGKL